MGDWGEILKELSESVQFNNGRPDHDGIRRKYLAQAAAHTGRSTILYASKFTQPPSQNIGQFVTISDGDLQGIMTVIHKLPGRKLDLILHSPGGSPQAAEAVVSYLRSRFSHIRVIVPHLAMSAATMIACAADVVVMGKHSFLGPIDPQLVLGDGRGQGVVPAEAILDQFDLAKKECSDPKHMGAWIPILPQYGPALLIQCNHALALAKNLVEDWLQKYMLKRSPERKEKAKQIAEWLGRHDNWKSHSRHIPRDELKRRGFRIEKLEKDRKAQDLFLSVFHATTHTFTGTAAVKIIESNLGKAFINQTGTAQVNVPVPADQPSLPPAGADAPSSPSPEPSGQLPAGVPGPTSKRPQKTVRRKSAARKVSRGKRNRREKQSGT